MCHFKFKALGFILSLPLAITSHAQDNTTKVFDSHIHLTTKHYLMDIANPGQILNIKNNPEEINRKFGGINWIPVGANSRAKRIGKESSYRNYNQADYSQLRNVQGSILINSFYPFEKILTIKPFHRLVNRFFVTKIGLKRLKTIASQNNSPFKEFLAEYYFAKNLTETDKGTTIKFVKNIDELISCINNNTTAAIMAIEGAQVFHGDYISKKSRIKDWKCDENCEKEIISNIRIIKNLDHRLFFIGTSHFAWNRVSGHAKTLDKVGLRRKLVSILANSIKQRKSLFLKWGEGIHGEVDAGNYISTEDGYKLPITDKPEHLTIGKKVIEELLNPIDNRYNKPTYIDVKHMDIQAREEYYILKDSLEKVYKIKIPIIASHVAVSGENLAIAKATGLNPLFDRYEELKNPKKFYEDQLAGQENKYWRSVKKHLEGRSYNPFEGNINYEATGWFYPWSFNLYDEEIKKIHESDGFMGIMLDDRQLGSGMSKYTKDYKKEIKKHYLEYILNNPMDYKEFDEYWELEPLIRNMFYVAEHCGNHPCWDHITIGSDFDGIIDPHKIAPTAQSYPDLKNKLKDYFEAYIEIHKKQKSLSGLSPDNIIEKFFFENGRKFTRKYF